MGRSGVGLLMIAMLGGAVSAVAMQSGQSNGEATSTASRTRNDVPRQQPGKQNPDLKQSKRKHTHTSKHETGTQPANPGDVPQHHPGEQQSPDMKQSAPGTAGRTNTEHSNKRGSATNTRSTGSDPER